MAKVSKEDFVNEGSNEFTDIDSELYREYIFPVPNSKLTNTVRINKPLKLCVTDSGHKLWDAYNISHFIPYGWIELKWKVLKGKPNFVK